jgi:hypothetical protein
MTKGGDRPTLTEAVRQAIESALNGVHVCLPGVVQRYDKSTAKAEVKPVLSKAYLDETTEDMPVIANVPVVWMRTVNAVIHLPLAKGDTVLLVFSERSMDSWLSDGKVGAPPDRRKFDLSDAIAIPGLFPFSASNPATDGDAVEVIHGNASIKITESQVDINNGNLTVDV